MDSKVIVDDKALLKSFELQRARLKNLKPVMKIIAQDMQTQKDINFKKSKDPFGNAWASLSIDSTLKGAEIGLETKRKGDKPLLDTGRLRASFATEATAKLAKIGTNVKYAPTHQFGAKKGQYGRTKRGNPIPWGDIPKRQMIGINPRMRKKYNKLVLNYVLNGKLG